MKYAIYTCVATVIALSSLSGLFALSNQRIAAIVSGCSILLLIFLGAVLADLEAN